MIETSLNLEVALSTAEELRSRLDVHWHCCATRKSGLWCEHCDALDRASDAAWGRVRELEAAR